MQIKVYLFPAHIELGTILRFRSKLLARVFAEASVELVEVRWDGRMDSLPTEEQVLVRASTWLLPRFQGKVSLELINFCQQHGHLVFYDERLFDSEGRQIQNPDTVRQMLDQFIAALRTTQGGQS